MKVYITETQEYKNLGTLIEEIDNDIIEEEDFVEEDFEFNETLDAYCCTSEIFEFWHNFIKRLRKLQFNAGVEKFDDYYHHLKMRSWQIIEENDDASFTRDNYRQKLDAELHELEIDNLIAALEECYESINFEDREETISQVMTYAAESGFSITKTEANEVIEIVIKNLKEDYFVQLISDNNDS